MERISIADLRRSWAESHPVPIGKPEALGEHHQGDKENRSGLADYFSDGKEA